MLNIANLTINNLTVLIVGICVSEFLILLWLFRKSKRFDKSTKWVPKLGKVSRIVSAKLSGELEEEGKLG